MTMQAGRDEWKIRLRNDAVVLDCGEGVLAVQSTQRMQRLPVRTGPLSTVLTMLAEGRCAERELTEFIVNAAGSAAALRLQLLLNTLDENGWLERTVSYEGSDLATLVPLGHAKTALAPDLASTPLLTDGVRLSRFALLRTFGERLRLESGRSSIAVDFESPNILPLLGFLASGTTTDAAADALPALPKTVVAQLLAMLLAAGALTPAHPEQDPELTELRLAQWSLPDLLLHATARNGRRNAGYGGTYRFAERFSSLPAIPEQPAGTRVELKPPDLNRAAAEDPTLTQVLESRRSLRRHDDAAPITGEQLGELLYRTMRIRRTVQTPHEQLVDRPFPAGGSLHELEVYPVVGRCDGLDSGVWHYDAAAHAFDRVAEPSPAMAQLLHQARTTSLMERDPQVLLVITARFGRIMWKYESMAYALILKHVGVLYQTLYLAATAMGLAPCAQGGGNADLFAAASGLDYYTEGSVGEFVIGSATSDAASLWEAE